MLALNLHISFGTAHKIRKLLRVNQRSYHDQGDSINSYKELNGDYGKAKVKFGLGAQRGSGNTVKNKEHSRPFVEVIWKPTTESSSSNSF